MSLGKRALVTGATGQDGSYLVERLSRDGYEVHGMCRSADGAARLSADAPGVIPHICDLADEAGLVRLVSDTEPTHIFNLAGMTSVSRSWEFPAETAKLVGLAPIQLLQAALELSERTLAVRFVQASSAEIFGDTDEAPQTEATARVPVSPYGAAKNYAHDMVRVFRQRGLFASSAVLYHHESPRRPKTFVARKISREVARIARGRSKMLVLGNIDVHRDWGYAPDFVDALIRISEASAPNDFIVATGVSHSVRAFVDCAFRYVGIEDWAGYVASDPQLYRPADPRRLVGRADRMREIGWEPTVNFQELVHLMVDADLRRLA